MIKSNQGLSKGKVYSGRSGGDAKRITNTNPLQMLNNVRSGMGGAAGSLSEAPGTTSIVGVVQSGLGGRDLKMKPNKVVRNLTAKDYV